MSPKFKILDKKNIHDGFFKMNEVTLKYKKYDGNWSNEIKRELFGGAQISAVLPYDPGNEKIVLIQQFRAGTISKDSENYGKKTNSKLFFMGINHVELNQDGVIREWVLFDEVAIWKQILLNHG